MYGESSMNSVSFKVLSRCMVTIPLITWYRGWEHAVGQPDAAPSD